jgi:hypothetical protein
VPANELAASIIRLARRFRQRIQTCRKTIGEGYNVRSGGRSRSKEPKQIKRFIPAEVQNERLPSPAPGQVAEEVFDFAREFLRDRASKLPVQSFISTIAKDDRNRIRVANKAIIAYEANR